MHYISDIIEAAEKHHKNLNEELIRHAYEFGKTAHEKQKRASGESFFYHPIEAALTVANYGFDETSIAAALLHDVVEDTSIPIDEIEREFGQDIANIVMGVTNLKHLKYLNDKEDYQVENLRKMFLAMAKDIRVIVIKLADRLHNMRTLSSLPPHKRIEKSKETIEIYAPIASRLGMGQLRGELEDLAFKWISPEEYEQLSKKIHTIVKSGDRLLSYAKRLIRDKLNEENISATIQARQKHMYSLWKKMQRPGYDGDINKVPDLIALRVILENESLENCYKTLGIVHQLFTPIPGRVSDYIAVPKVNGYRSLHTKVFLEKGKIMEIQIRTRRMHEESEYGNATHIVYEQEKTRSKTTSAHIDQGFHATKEQLKWIHELTKWQRETTDSKGFLEGLRFDLFKDRIFVFTPQGDVKDLPVGATPVDFAYAVHSEIGDRCVGAKVDNALVPLSFRLRSGQIIEIITSKEKKNPSPDWIKFVVTNQARKRILKYLNRSHIPEEMREERPTPKEPEKQKSRQLLDLLLPSSSLMNPFSILERVQSVLSAKFRKKNMSGKPQIVVHGHEGVATRLAQCCNPLPGDNIVGLVTRESSISIHRINCFNVKNIIHKDKQVQVEWVLPGDAPKTVRLELHIPYKEGAMRMAIKAISESKVDVEKLEQLPSQRSGISLRIVIQFETLNQKSVLLTNLRKIKDITIYET